MDCHWLKLTASVLKGLATINKLDETRFEQFLRRILAKLKLHDAEIFTEEECLKLQKIFNIDREALVLSIKTIQYLFKRILKFIFMPSDLKNDLKSVGLNNNKAESIVKVWSAETRTILTKIGTVENDQTDTLNFSWKLSAELSSDYQKKCKVPKAYLLIAKDNDSAELELTHPDLHSLFMQCESIQNELDNIIV